MRSLGNETTCLAHSAIKLLIGERAALMKSKLSLSSAICALACGVVLAPTDAHAQNDSNPVQSTDASTTSQGIGLEEITVTATRRETSLQSTPVAISAIDSNTIQQASPRNIGDLASFVPNFSASTITGFNSASFSMRGIGQTTPIIYYESPVGVLVDDFVITSVQTQLLDTFDVSQIEVLRGPQGTLFGKNTTGGAVVVKTKKPNASKIEAELQARIGSFGTRDIQAALNIPLVADKIALRIVSGYQSDDGFYRNGGCFGPVVGTVANKWQGAVGCFDGRRVGGRNVWSGRAKLLVKPSDDIDMLFQYEKIHDREDPVPAVNENYLYQNSSATFLTDRLGIGQKNDRGDPLDRAIGSYRDQPLIEFGKRSRIDVDGYYLNIDYSSDIGRLTSVTGYRAQRSRLPNSYGGASAISPDGAILSFFDTQRNDNRNTFQQELRLATNTGSNVDVVLGGFYQKEDINFCVAKVTGYLDLTVGPTPFGPYNDTPQLLCNSQKSQSTAIFLEGTYKLTDRISFTTGMRYTWENKKWRGRQDTFIPRLNGGNDPLIVITEGLDANVDNYPFGVVSVSAKTAVPTWRGIVAYEASDRIYTYASYARGFKAGGFSDQVGGFAPFGTNLAAFAVAAAPTKPERADSFEVGLKSELFDRRVRFNLTGFVVKYNDLQRELSVPIVVGGQQFVITRFVNAAGATVKGLELELTGRVVNGLTLRANGGYQDGRYDRFDVPIVPGAPASAGYDLASAPLLRLPKWTWSVDGTYDFELSNGYSVMVNVNTNHVSKNLFSQSLVDATANSYLNARTLFNASINVSDPSHRYSAKLVARNIANSRYRTATTNVSRLWLHSQFGPPRYLGVEFGVKFGAN
jgi:iron complex outermembrane recepter protein